MWLQAATTRESVKRSGTNTVGLLISDGTANAVSGATDEAAECRLLRSTSGCGSDRALSEQSRRAVESVEKQR